MTPFFSDGEKNGAFVSALLGVHDIVSESVDRRAVFFAAVPSSIMRKFIYKSGRTQSAQGRETCP